MKSMRFLSFGGLASYGASSLLELRKKLHALYREQPAIRVLCESYDPKEEQNYYSGFSL